MRAAAITSTDIRMISASACLVGAAISLDMAWLHARSIEALGVICGRSAEVHCAWCPLAAVLLVTSLFLFGAGLRSRDRPRPSA